MITITATMPIAMPTINSTRLKPRTVCFEFVFRICAVLVH